MMISGGLLAFAFLASCTLSQAASAQGAHQLSAPTYYIAVNARLEYGNTITVRGVSNLPSGADLSLDLLPENGSGSTQLPNPVCVPIDEKGLFKQEISFPASLPHPKELYVRVSFLTNMCKQPAHVLQIVGRHGEFLGNDDHHVTMDEVENGWTIGMFKNPQLFQVSGWYFGISDLTWVEGWR